MYNVNRPAQSSMPVFSGNLEDAHNFMIQELKTLLDLGLLDKSKIAFSPDMRTLYYYGSIMFQLTKTLDLDALASEPQHLNQLKK